MLLQLYAKASEAESWMKDKKPLVLQEEYGKDEDGTQVRRLLCTAWYIDH